MTNKKYRLQYLWMFKRTPSSLLKECHVSFYKFALQVFASHSINNYGIYKRIPLCGIFQLCEVTKI